MSRRPNLVYFIRPIGQDGPIKIGCSISPAGRLDTLMAWAPVPLEIVVTIPGDLRLERRIHGVFADLHSHREWFQAAPRLTAFVASIAAGSPVGDLIDLSAPLPVFRAKKKRNYSEDRRLYLSYAGRVRHAYKQFWAPRSAGKYPPNDVDHILNRWSKRHNSPCVSPTPAEIARLDEAIRNPHLHAVSYEQKWPLERAA